MSDRFHTSQPIDCGGLKISGTEVISSSGAIIGDIQATAKSISSTELADNTIKTATVTLTPTTIVGTDAGDLGHSAGVELVAAPGTSYILEFVSAVLSYDFGTAAYTGGGDDLVIRQGTTSVSAAIAAADLLGDSADDIAYVNALSAADIKLTANSNLNIKSTAFTNPGSAAGTCKVHVQYRVHAV